MQVDYEARKASLEILADVDPASIRASPSLVRDETQYAVLLYFIRARRGATSLNLDDVTDLRDDSGLCGRVLPLSAIAGDVLYIYSFLTGGIDKEVDQPMLRPAHRLRYSHQDAVFHRGFHQRNRGHVQAAGQRLPVPHQQSAQY